MIIPANSELIAQHTSVNMKETQDSKLQTYMANQYRVYVTISTIPQYIC